MEDDGQAVPELQIWGSRIVNDRGHSDFDSVLLDDRPG